MKTLIKATGTIFPKYSDDDDCICCEGKHRYTTDVEWRTKSESTNETFNDISSFIHNYINKLPKGAKIGLTLTELDQEEENIELTEIDEKYRFKLDCDLMGNTNDETKWVDILKMVRSTGCRIKKVTEKFFYIAAPSVEAGVDAIKALNGTNKGAGESYIYEWVVTGKEPNG